MGYDNVKIGYYFFLCFKNEVENPDKKDDIKNKEILKVSDDICNRLIFVFYFLEIENGSIVK